MNAMILQRTGALLLPAIALALLVTLAACGGSEEPTAPISEPTATGGASQPTEQPTPLVTAAQSTPADAPIPTPTELPGLETLWRYELENHASSATVTSDGRVYVSAGRSLFVLGLETGELLWQEDIDIYGGIASPIVVDGIAYVGEEGGGGSGDLFALNPETGELLWHYDTRAVVHVPTIVDGIVYVATRDQGIAAVDAKSGDTLRSYEFDSLVSFSPFGNSSPTVTDGKLYSALNEGTRWYAFAMDLESGELLWRYAIPGWMYVSPQVQDGAVYVSSSGTMYALNRTSGELLWQFEHGGAERVWDRIWHVVYEGTVYVRVGGNMSPDNNPLYALDAQTGEVLWSYEGGQGFYWYTVSILLDGILYLGAEDGNLHALDPESGRVLRTYMDVGIVFSVTPGSDGKVRILGTDGRQIYLLVGDAAR